MVDAALKEAMLELRENESTRSQSIREVRGWVEKHPDLRNCRTDDSFLLRFLRARKFSVLSAEETLLRFAAFLKKEREVTVGCDILDPIIADLFSNRFLFTSPYRDAKGRQITILVVRNIDVHRTSYQHTARAMWTHLFTLMEDEVSQVLGHVYIIDGSNLHAGHTTYWPLPLLVRCIEATQKAFPLRQKELHLLNINPVFKVMTQLMLKVSSPKIRQRFRVHACLEELHKEVNPEALPKEYGGEMTIEEMVEWWKTQLISKRNLVKGLEDIELVQNSSTQVEMGSFRKLEVD